ncbi:hypothetical protein SUGI_0960330 [Cryptomeria japonica]|nr:hypothetical protein SUGI_0960330 [Cryptomeria japonica]
MQGETRMCQEVADFLNPVNFNGKEIRIAGLYGMSGLGKSTLAKSFCNFSLENFSGKVCFLQFGGCNALDRQKHALQCLTQFPMDQLKSITCEDDAQYNFNTFVKGQRSLLVLDNITEDSIDEVRHYLGAEYGENTCILLIARRVDVLKNLNIDSQSCMHVPRLEKEEAIAILLERMYVKIPELGAEQRGYALKCANRCSFKENKDSAPTFHPLALKALGRHLFSKHGTDLSKWVAEIDGFTNRAADGLDGMFVVLEKAFDDMDPRYRRIVVFLATHMPQNKSSDNVVKWVTTNCNEELCYIKEAVS